MLLLLLLIVTLFHINVCLQIAMLNVERECIIKRLKCKTQAISLMVSDFWIPLYVHAKDSLHAPQQHTMQINSCFLYSFCISSKYKERRQWRRASAKKEQKG